VADKEIQLAKTLVDASTSKHFDFGDYEDQYTKRLAKLLEARASGKRVVSERRDEEPAVVNLMDALRQSLAQAKGGTKPKKTTAAKKTTAKKTTAAKKTHHRVVGRRKTG